MALHVIVGAGPIGSATATHLVAEGHRIRMITRSGSGPAHPAIERIAADATDTRRLTQLAAGAAVIYNCANPPYHRWPRDWPPLAGALLRAAEETGAVLATMSNLYGYGPVDGPMTPDLPLRPTSGKGRVRAAMWDDALRAHQSGRIRTTEVRASDYLGPGTRSIVTEMLLPAVRRGRRAYLPVDFDVPHSLTFADDAARTLVTVACDERGWGRPWHAPTPAATTLREVAERYAAIVGAPAPRLRSMSRAVLRLGALTNTSARAFIEMRYQFQRPFVLDSSDTERTFGLAPTSQADALRSMA